MDQKAPVDVAMAFVAKINEHDVAGLVSLKCCSGRPQTRGQESFRGADQTRQGWKAYFARFPAYAIEVTDEFRRGEIVGMFGKARGTFAVNGKLPRENSCGVARCGERRTRGRMARLLRQRSSAEDNGRQRACEGQPLTPAD
jgi:hypothetical protein